MLRCEPGKRCEVAMEWLLIAVIVLAYVVATVWDNSHKTAIRARLGNDHTIATVEKFLPEVHRSLV